MFVKIILCITLISSLRQALSKKPKIAIVGSGIGGSSCSYFLRDHLKDEVDIEIYEANEIGGRLATVKLADGMYETGSCVYHNRHKYMEEFRQKFKLERLWDPNQEIALRDNHGMQFFSGRSMIITPLKALWKYGFVSLRRTGNFIGNLLNKFDRIYKLQEEGNAYATVEALLAAADTSLPAFFKLSADYGFRTYVKTNKKTINDVVKSTLRVNYGQTTDVHLFLSAIAISGLFFWTAGIKGGNRIIPQSLVDESGAQLHKLRVEKIIFNERNKEYIVESVSQTNERVAISYDVVIIANPITSDSKTPIEFANFNPPITVEGQYQRIVTTLVSGNLDHENYHLSKNSLPDMIVENDDPLIMAVSKAWSVVDVVSKKKIPHVWKIMSLSPLTENKLDAMFLTPKVVEVRDWLAYPKYEKLSLEDGNFVLHDRLFYVNAIEWAASTMEMSIIGAKNVALLVEKELRPPKNV